MAIPLTCALGRPKNRAMDELSHLVSMIDLGGAMPRRGASQPLSIAYERDLTMDDLAGLQSGALVSTTPPIAKLKSAHHNMARLLADGRKAVEVSAITGYSQSRISLLQKDPAFAELVQYYKAQAAEVYLDVHSRLAQVGMGALDELQDRLDEKPETFTNKELQSLVETTFDRSVAPPKGGAKVGQGGNAPPPVVTINFISPPEGGPQVTIEQDPA